MNILEGEEALTVLTEDESYQEASLDITPSLSISQLPLSLFRLRLCSNLCILQCISGERSYISCDMDHKHWSFFHLYSK